VNPSAGAPVNAAFTGQRFDGLIEACRQQDMGVMVIRIFAAGVLATRRRHGREVMVADGTNVDDDAARADQVFGALGIADGNRAETAIRFGLSHPDVSAVIFGLATLDHLKIALGAATAGPLDARALATLRQFHETAMA